MEARSEVRAAPTCGHGYPPDSHICAPDCVACARLAASRSRRHCAETSNARADSSGGKSEAAGVVQGMGECGNALQDEAVGGRARRDGESRGSSRGCACS
eukprot:1852835-Rhodomonas_salina.2